MTDDASKYWGGYEVGYNAGWADAREAVELKLAAVREEIAHAEANGHKLAADCQSVGPGEYVPAVRVANILLPKPRLTECVKRWPECQSGEYDPACCRFPKSCSCTVYDVRRLKPGDLES